MSTNYLDRTRQYWWIKDGYVQSVRISDEALPLVLEEDINIYFNREDADKACYQLALLEQRGA